MSNFAKTETCSVHDLNDEFSASQPISISKYFSRFSRLPNALFKNQFIETSAMLTKVNVTLNLKGLLLT